MNRISKSKQLSIMKHFVFLLIGIVNLLLMTPSNVLAQSTHNGYEYVDLGLSVKWATCNVGSTSPEDYGYYFAWGETSNKSTYTDNNYKFYGESINRSKRYIKKYNSEEYRGYIDNKTLLDPEDDVAHVMWGGDWYLPSKDEFEELIKNCTWTWVTQNGKNGFKVTSKKNGNSIFLPAADRKDAYRTTIENNGFYLTNERCVHDEDDAYCLRFFEASEPDYVFHYSRSYGCSARPVFRPRVHPMVTSEHVGHEYVDLGLSVKWSTCNLGAKSHEKRGYLYRWGEVDASGSKSYKWQDERGKPTKYNKNDNMTKLESQDDAAHVTWGGSWRMPSNDEWEELITNCDGEYVLQNGVSGLLLTSKRNGNTLFLPLENYWSSSLYTPIIKFALTISTNRGFLRTLRTSKLPIRPVCP